MVRGAWHSQDDFLTVPVGTKQSEDTFPDNQVDTFERFDIVVGMGRNLQSVPLYWLGGSFS
ncbi:MAG: hypothetical protein KGZ93_09295 [Actinobacteria bacterium]|nr:hypothetical protein [Actinomycetota bacterium]